ncbi:MULTISPECIES: type I-E CRISPR-associated protein Cse2/CasB [Actinoalloteichus]|uniref:CRISPR type I-E/ECOLI-associated protein CasB/Cse2 n=1 Tax=Actinoalloteichus fjordicus TaxID=1612552 RepID=A0AAC9LFB5_9PSEU|nr:MULTISPECIES: type I-E CRISPR-associated protein Cse2/CasB [Actinoalloteichus]APU16636.1 CRISPR type I-E/ECOLI-associated protein CasB/Cse2 [Actinoalloteichus fjordicus]APU22702.1 CRISPR type I-E/ECOLI-associated protein CasB/Cse2 [Actinoalloteichus sp. GBA129-24]
MTTESIAVRPPRNRDVFVASLYRLHSGLNSTNAHRVADARRVLAALRRSLVSPHQASAAYDLVFGAEPAPGEQDAWLLTAGLFGIHPQARASGRTLGIAMRDLKGDGQGMIDRRFEQLLAVDRRNLPHYLRQAVRLLKSKQIALDYGRLLDDVAVLLDAGAAEEQKRRVRLAWARDFHKPRHAAVVPATGDDSADDSEESAHVNNTNDTEN